jgi:hypothetical protein
LLHLAFIGEAVPGVDAERQKLGIAVQIMWGIRGGLVLSDLSD